MADFRTMLVALAEHQGSIYFIEDQCPYSEALVEAAERLKLARVFPAGGSDPVDCLKLTAAGYRSIGLEPPAVAKGLRPVLSSIGQLLLRRPPR